MLRLVEMMSTLNGFLTGVAEQFNESFSRLPLISITAQSGMTDMAVAAHKIYNAYGFPALWIPPVSYATNNFRIINLRL